ncbi:MAG: D-alanyl-D-alanine carboxypeptidase/D-alanyl-D-alanine-endopeptidase [Ignavibacteriales bacterium]|nr:D-alanyl-D-alanine carboxypeptidase/D-alanyl-D-alanine-endopeptidase [Ignavibacteriales bacterium]
MTTLARSLALALLAAIVCRAQHEALAERIDEKLDDLPRGSHAAVLVVNPLISDTLYQRNIHEPMILASNTKLFTTAVALYLLGPDYPLSTKLLCDDDNLRDGVLDGNLYVKGYGNSAFDSDDLDRFAQTVLDSGATLITGDVIGDDLYFDSEYIRRDWIEDEQTSVDLPPVSALSLDKNQTLKEYRYRRRLRRKWVNISNPPLFFAERLRDSLVAKGATVQGEPHRGFTPPNAVEIADASIPLKELVKIVNKRSDNFRAEVLFKTLGAAATGDQGNAMNSSQTIHKFLKDNGIYKDGAKLVDGSGLSRYNYASADQIVALLTFLYLDVRMFDVYYSSLSVAGVDGTLSGRMQGASAEFNFRGKTGTLNGVSTVSGYLVTSRGEELIVSVLMSFNRRGAGHYRAVQDEIIEMLASYDYSPYD